MADAMLRTPETRFAGLPGFEAPLFAPHWIESLPGLDGARIHYLDSDPAGDAPVALCLHGNPSWCYLYRKMAPALAAAGFRVVAPDLAGFGRSDKPADAAWHTFERHRAMLLAFVESLDLRRITLVVQDWGGLLGLTLPMQMPERFERLLAMNTAFGTGELSEGFRAWRDYSNRAPDLPVGALIARGDAIVTPAEAAAYDAPFPDASFKAALRAFPVMVPDAQRALPSDAQAIALSRQAREWFGSAWRGDSFIACGMRDPVLGPPAMVALQRAVRGAAPLFEVPEAGHFAQERGEAIVAAALAAWGLAKA